jgi:hypothetical protein
MELNPPGKAVAADKTGSGLTSPVPAALFAAMGIAISPRGGMLKHRVRFSEKDAACPALGPHFLSNVFARSIHRAVLRG